MLKNLLGTLTIGCLLAANASAAILTASATDNDATLSLAIEDTLVAGVTQLWGTLRIVVDDNEELFTAGDSIELWLYEDDTFSDDLLWQNSFTISSAELSAGFVDRTFNLSFMAPTDDPGGSLEIFAVALVDKDTCSGFCTFDNPVTQNLQVALAPAPVDTDGDGDPDSIDPDDDNDGITDALDTEPLIANNDCTTNDGTHATLVSAQVTDDLTCASKESVDVNGDDGALNTVIFGSEGDLRLISERVIVKDTIVEVGGRMEIINADPLPSCDPVNPVTLCGDGIRCRFPADPDQPPFCAGNAGTAGIGGVCADDSDCQADSLCVFQAGGVPGSGGFRCASTCEVATPTTCNGFQICASLDPPQIIQGTEYGACIVLPP